MTEQFALNDDQEMMRRAVREIATQFVAPRAAAIDEEEEFPWDVKEVFARHDLLGLHIPVEYGGVGADEVTSCLAIEEVARVCASSALIIGVQQLGTLPILIAGNEDQRRHYFSKIASGEHLAAFGLTEPGAGSDVAGMTTRAVRKDGAYVLNGGKRFITQANVADVLTTFAKTDPSAGHRGISAFIVDKSCPGWKIGRIEKKLGIRGSPTCEVLFEDCVVPAENLLSQEGQGFKIAMYTLDRSRTGIAAQALGIAQGALDAATDYAKQRVQFGQPIASFQGIQFMLADMAMQVEAARYLLYRAAVLIGPDPTQPASPEAVKFSAIAKCFAADAAMRVTTDAVQVLGGYGYVRDFPVERMMRDAKITQIYEGTNQIQRLLIARQLLGR